MTRSVCLGCLLQTERQPSLVCTSGLAFKALRPSCCKLPLLTSCFQKYLKQQSTRKSGNGSQGLSVCTSACNHHVPTITPGAKPIASPVSGQCVACTGLQPMLSNVGLPDRQEPAPAEQLDPPSTAQEPAQAQAQEAVPSGEPRYARQLAPPCQFIAPQAY